MSQSRDDDARKRIDVECSTEISFELDDEKIAAIRACLDKGGPLTVRIKDVDLSRSGRAHAAYIWH
jgi:hypothetical protein